MDERQARCLRHFGLRKLPDEQSYCIDNSLVQHGNKTMVEFDIIFDTDHVWAINSDPNNPDLTKTDLQNIATHELDHRAGLGDVYRDAAYQETMYGYSSLGEISKRDLYTDDKQGIKNYTVSRLAISCYSVIGNGVLLNFDTSCH